MGRAVEHLEAGRLDRTDRRGWASVLAVLAVTWFLGLPSSVAAGQLGALISPGPLAKVHAELEGIRQCQSCHEAGQRVSAPKCLTCHKPVAERIAAKRGVHRAVTTDCVTCHVEHMGTSAELRPFETKTFDHARDAGYPLDGKHAAKAGDCASCHKERSYLEAATSCQSCHDDVHRGSLGTTCTKCHSTAAAFKDAKTGFDHAAAAFPLVGAHRRVTCEQCHTSGTYKVAKFSACVDCHKEPHRPSQGANCGSCHGNDNWRTTKFDHRRTAYPLAGKHADVACAACHVKPAMQVKPATGTCASCHADPHRGAFKDDCKSCHTERSFADAPFDHGSTAFALGGKHASAACESCHKNSSPVAPVTARPRPRTASAAPAVVDFRGLKSTCVSCHEDAHTGELGASCETCHDDTTFHVVGYRHAGAAAFFEGQHAAVACEGCHKPDPLTKPVRTGASLARVARYKTATTRCVSCHEDVHLGQLDSACESCHTIQQPKFEVPAFAHDRTSFALTGAHATTPCRGCHVRETAKFPASFGTATRMKGVGRTCVACHKDVHVGQLGTQCEQCHSTTNFDLDHYAHREAAGTLKTFFIGAHLTARCEQCHVPATGRFASGSGTAVVYRVDARCVTCHADVHRGQMGERCADCHRLKADATSPSRGPSNGRLVRWPASSGGRP